MIDDSAFQPSAPIPRASSPAAPTSGMPTEHTADWLHVYIDLFNTELKEYSKQNLLVAPRGPDGRDLPSRLPPRQQASSCAPVAPALPKLKNLR